MAFSSPDNDVTTTYGVVTTVTLSVAVSAGDLIVVCACSQPGFVVTDISDSDENIYTLHDVLSPASATVAYRSGYCLSATSTTNPLTITVTYGAGNGGRIAAVGIFHPDGGETVSTDGYESSTSGFEASPFESPGGVNTTGTDVVAIGGFSVHTSVITSNHEIPSGTAADGVITQDSYGLDMFYRILSATVSNAEAEMDSDTTAYYTAELMCFKSVAGTTTTTTTTSSTTTPVPDVAIFRRRIECG